MKPSIAFVTGGYSGESIISYKSAVNILKNIDADKFDVYKIDITPQGWFYESVNGQRSTVSKEDFSIIDNERKINFDAVLIGIHGTPGEDGKLQGYFDLMNLPYTSCDAATSALTFNKRYTVAIASFAGIQAPTSVNVFKQDHPDTKEVAGRVAMPV